MITTSLQLTIKEPCSAEWESMTPAGRNRHCASCNKIVVDFTSMSDAELVGYFEKRATDEMCGRFVNSQLAGPVTSPMKLSWWKYMAAALLPAIFSITKGYTQGAPRIRGSESVTPGVAQENNRLLRIIVVSESGAPLAAASIFNEGSGKGVTTDTLGLASLTIGSSANQEVTISSIGWETQRLVIPAGKQELIVTLKRQVVELGEVVVKSKSKVCELNYRVGGVGYYMTSVMSTRDTARTKAADTGLVVFPNPLRSGGWITLSSANAAHQLNVTIHSIDGKMVLTRVFQETKFRRQVRLQLPSLAAGVYIVRVNDHSAKIVIE